MHVVVRFFACLIAALHATAQEESAGLVVGLDQAGDEVLQNHGITEEATQGTWASMNMTASFVSADASGRVWLVDKTARLLSCENGNCVAVEQVQNKTVSKLSVSADWVWVVTSDAALFRGSLSKGVDNLVWEEIDAGAHIASVSVCPNNKVWAITTDNRVFWHDGAISNNLLWSVVPGQLQSVACSNKGVWGLNAADGGVMFRHGITATDSRGFRWESVGPNMKQISTSPNGLLWGVDNSGGLWRRSGISGSSPAGTSWVVVDSNITFTHVSIEGFSLSVPTAATDDLVPLESLLPLSGRWTNFGDGHRESVVEKIGQLCFLSGRVISGEWTQFARLQPPCQPRSDLMFALPNGNQASVVTVTTSGEVRYTRGSALNGWIALDGIVFPPLTPYTLASAISPLQIWRAPEIASQQTGMPNLRSPVVMTIPGLEGLCILSGVLVGGLAGQIGTMPEKCVPSSNRVFGVASSSGISKLHLSTDGTMSLAGFDDSEPAEHRWVSLDGCAFSPQAASKLTLGPDWAPDTASEPTLEVFDSGVCLLGGVAIGPVSPEATVAIVPSYCRPPATVSLRAFAEQIAIQLELRPNGRLVVTALADDLGIVPVSLEGMLFDPNALHPDQGSKVTGPLTPKDPTPPTQTSLNLNGLWQPYDAPERFRTGVVELTEEGVCAASGTLRIGKRNDFALLPSYCRSPANLLFIANADGRPTTVTVHQNKTLLFRGRQLHLPQQRVVDQPRPLWLDVSSIVYALPADEPDFLPLLGEWKQQFEIFGLPGHFSSATVSHVGHLCFVSGLVGGLWPKVRFSEHATVALLPLHCRPKHAHVFTVPIGTGPVAGIRSEVPSKPFMSYTTVVVHPSGHVELRRLSLPEEHSEEVWVSLTGVTFDPTGTTPLELSGSWAHFSHGDDDFAPPTVTKEGNLCALGGVARGDSWGRLAMLPASCRPAGRLSFVTNSNHTTSRIDILESGEIQLVSGVVEDGWVSLSGIVFDPVVDSQIVAAGVEMLSTAAKQENAAGDTSVALHQGDFIRVPDCAAFDQPGALTLEFWFRAKSNNASLLVGRAKHASGAATGASWFGVEWQGVSKPLAFFDRAKHTGKRILGLGHWHHVALVIDASARKTRLFVDGEMDVETDMAQTDPCSTAKTSTSANDLQLVEACHALAGCTFNMSVEAVCFTDVGTPIQSSDLFIGGTPARATFQGRISDLRLWSVVRTQDQIAETKTSRLPPWTKGLIGYWEFASADGLLFDSMMAAPVAVANGQPLFVNGGPGLVRAMDSAAGGVGDPRATSSLITTHGRLRVAHQPKLQFSNSEPLTLELWFRANEDAAAESWVLLKNGDYGVQWRGRHQPLRFYDGNFHDSRAKDFMFGNWYHVAVVDRGAGDNDKTITLYVDGMLDSVQPRTPHRFGAWPLHIGGLDGHTFDGSIADVRLWRLARSALEIRRSMHRRLLGSEPGLAAYFPFTTKDSALSDASDEDVAVQTRGTVEWSGAGPSLDAPLPLPRASLHTMKARGDSQPTQGGTQIGANVASEIAASAQHTGLEFDGTNQVALPANVVLAPTAQDWSVLFLIKGIPGTPSAKPANLGAVLSFWPSTGNDMVAFVSDDTLRIVYGNMGASIIDTKFDLSTEAADKFRAVALVASAEDRVLRVFVDGVQRFETSQDELVAPLFAGPGTIVLGQQQGCPGACLLGSHGLRAVLKHLSLWKRSLSLDELRDRAASPVVPTSQLGALVAWFRMDEGKGLRLLDSSPNGLHGDMGAVQIVDRTAAPPTKAFPQGVVVDVMADSTASLESRAFASESFPPTLVDIGATCAKHGVFGTTEDGFVALKFNAGTGLILSDFDDVVGTHFTLGVVAKLDNPQNTALVSVSHAKDRLFLRNSTLRSETEQSAAVVQPNTWFSLFVSRTPQTVSVYLDGKLAKHFSSLPTALQAIADGDLILFNGESSGQCEAGVYSSAGWFRRVLVWDRALTVEDISTASSQALGMSANDGLFSASQSVVAHYVVEASAPLENKRFTNISALLDIGTTCNKPFALQTDKRFGVVARFAAGTGFSIPISRTTLASGVFSLALLFKLSSGAEVETPVPLVTTSSNSGLFVSKSRIVALPSNTVLGTLHVGEWHKLVLVQEGSSGASVFLDGSQLASKPTADDLGTGNKDPLLLLLLFASSATSCGPVATAQGTAGEIKELQLFSKALSEAEVAALMPNRALLTESRRAFAFTGKEHMKASVLDFPTRVVSMCMRYRPTGADTTNPESTFVSIAAAPNNILLELLNPSSVTLRVGSSVLDSKVDVRNGTFHHICFSISHPLKMMLLYVNGAQAGATTLAEASGFPAKVEIVFGQAQTCAGGCWTPSGGLIGELFGLRLWQAVLTRAEIAEDRSRMARPSASQLRDHTTGVPSDSVLYAMWAPEAAVGAHVQDVAAAHTLNLGAPGWVVDCPNRCSDRGRCGPGGHCICDAGFEGEDCSRGCPNSCNLQGTCNDGKCTCIAGFRGVDCSIAKDPNEDVISDQCSTAPESQLLFCTMINHTIPATLAGPQLIEADEKASQTFKRLAQFCPSDAGREVLKHAVCGSYLLKCTDQGKPLGICKSQCRTYEALCKMPVSACDAGMYVDDSEPCYTSYPLGHPGAVNETCPRDCSENGKCENGLCSCFTGYSGADCSQYDGDTTKVPSELSFCRDVVHYAVPAVYNDQWSDSTAERAYNLLSPFCYGRLKGLVAMRQTLCATSFFKVKDGKVLKPCRSMCMDYAVECGISEGLSCFSNDFYSEEPNCFKLDYSDQLQSAAMESLGTDVPDPQTIVLEHTRCPDNYTCVHGACIHGRCSCMRGWFGLDCAVEIPRCPNYCSGHGVCQDERCKCLPGWTGDDCSVATDLCDFDCEEDGWRSDTCCTTLSSLMNPSLKEKQFVSPGCGNNCSGQGVCVHFEGFEACECDSGFTSWDCSTQDMCTNNCSGHGYCVFDAARNHSNRALSANDLYTTTTNQFDILDTGSQPPTANILGLPHPEPIPRHPNVTSSYTQDTPSSKSFHFPKPLAVATGLPSWTNSRATCRCMPSFFGTDCSLQAVNITRCVHSCSQHGKCALWKPGSTATVETVSYQKHNASSNETAAAVRSRHYQIHHAQYKCHCDAGYTGDDCGMPKPCPNDCSGSGVCVLGQCECHAFRAGIDCSVVVPECNKHFKCLNLGVCDATLTKCNCPPFYHGNDCSLRTSAPLCPNDYKCENGGRCFEGKCLCPPSTYGYDCNGSQALGLQSWDRGWSGYDLPKDTEAYKRFKSAAVPLDPRIPII